MPWSPDYITVAELRAHMAAETAGTDTPFSTAITAASRAIDHHCGRQFGLTGSAVARVYTYAGECLEGRAALAVDDVQTTTGLALAFDLDDDGTYEESLTLSTDYDLWPWNAAADGKPWTHVVLRPTAAAYFPSFARGVQVTGNWGWSSVPTLVKQACLIQASRYYVRKDAAFGIAGSPENGNEMRLLERLDPDVASMLQTVRRPWGAA